MQALTFDREFARFRGPLVLALMIAGLVHYLVVTIHGRWRPVTRNLEVVLGLFTCAVLTWVLFAGAVYPSPDSDRTVKFSVAIIVAVSLVDLLFKAWRLLRQPAANLMTSPPGSL